MNRVVPCSSLLSSLTARRLLHLRGHRRQQSRRHLHHACHTQRACRVPRDRPHHRACSHMPAHAHTHTLSLSFSFSPSLSHSLTLLPTVFLRSHSSHSYQSGVRQMILPETSQSGRLTSFRDALARILSLEGDIALSNLYQARLTPGIHDVLRRMDFCNVGVMLTVCQCAYEGVCAYVCALYLSFFCLLSIFLFRFPSISFERGSLTSPRPIWKVPTSLACCPATRASPWRRSFTTTVSSSGSVLLLAYLCGVASLSLSLSLSFSLSLSLSLSISECHAPAWGG
jgi:hypothetical protein